MLEEERRLEGSLRDLRRGRRGRVRVGASMAFEQPYFFERVVAPFRRAHEGVPLSVRFGHSPREAQAVLDHELDLAYVLDWELPPDAAFEPLHSARFTFLAPRDHPLARKDAVTVDDVLAAGLITAPLGRMESFFFRRVLRECGIDDHQAQLEIDGVQPRVMAAEAGLGVFGTFYPEYAGEVATGSLVPLIFDGPSPRVEVGLVAASGSRTGASSVQLFADWLRRLARP